MLKRVPNMVEETQVFETFLRLWKGQTITWYNFSFVVWIGSEGSGSPKKSSELGDEMNDHIYAYKSITFLLISQR